MVVSLFRSQVYCCHFSFHLLFNTHGLTLESSWACQTQRRTKQPVSLKLQVKISSRPSEHWNLVYHQRHYRPHQNKDEGALSTTRSRQSASSNWETLKSNWRCLSSSVYKKRTRRCLFPCERLDRVLVAGSDDCASPQIIKPDSLKLNPPKRVPVRDVSVLVVAVSKGPVMRFKTGRDMNDSVNPSRLSFFPYWQTISRLSLVANDQILEHDFEQPFNTTQTLQPCFLTRINRFLSRSPLHFWVRPFPSQASS
mgnify:CR=1 FL=1